MKSKRLTDERAIAYWALTFSLAAHVIGLAVAGAMRFSSVNLSGNANRTVSAVIVQQASASSSAAQQNPPVETVVPEPVCEPSSVPSLLTCAPQPPQTDAPPTPVEPDSEPIPPVQPSEETWFCGHHWPAQRVCFVIDGSGSMNGLMYLVRQHLRSSIAALDSRQAFDILLAGEKGTIQAVFDRRLQGATVEAKAAALNALAQFKPKGQTDIEAALTAALTIRDKKGRTPEVIYLVTDGFDLITDTPSVFLSRLQSVFQSLPTKPVIHTIGVYPRPADETLLRQIAQQFGGICQIVQ